jgi:diguanylate cyclase
VTPNITPFMIVCTIMAFFLILPPKRALAFFIAALVLFNIVIGFYQKDVAVLLSNRVNGITFCIIGFILSLLIWHARSINILQDQIIKGQQTELQQLAFYDNLTGLLNRRRWLVFLKDEMERLNRYGQDCSLFLMDIDHFKAVNDRYGHPTGDKVLEEVSYILKRELRTTDKLARWGGEEFAVLLPETSLENAVASAEKVRRSMEEFEIKLGGMDIVVTASFGVTKIQQNEDFEVCYNRADQALYLAKRMGRNQVRSIVKDDQDDEAAKDSTEMDKPEEDTPKKNL